MTEGKILEVGDDVVNKVAELLNTSEEEMDESVEKVRKWMGQQQHLPEIMDAKRVQNFLILNKCDMEKTKEKIDLYYTMRSKWGDIFENINPKLPHMQSLLEAYYFLALPKLTKELYRVFVFKIRDKNLAAEVDHWNTLRYSVNAQELRLREDVCFGDIFILDGQDMPLIYLLKITPLWLYRTVKIYEGVFSMRIKAVYIVNFPTALVKILKIAKSFMKPKIFARIHICQDYEFLKTTFDPQILPKDYGGEEKSLEELQEMLKLKVVEYEDVFDKLDTLRVKEDRRLPKENNVGLTRYFSFRRISRR